MSLSTTNLSFYTAGNRGTVRKTGYYEPEKACETLYRSMKGLGTDEDAIINVVAMHSFQQRQEIKMLYKHKYGKDLLKELDSELSFSFSKTVLALMKRPEEFIVESIHSTISKSRAARLLKQLSRIYKKGLGSDEYSLIALVCPRSNEQLEAIKRLYKKKYHSELVDDLGYDLGDDLRSLIIDMISGGRESEMEVNLEKVLEDADNLHVASFVPQGEICGTKERVLQQILNSRSYDHLRSLITAYQDVSNKSLEEYIENTNLSQDLKETYLAIVKILRSEPEYYAERLRESIKGLGTDDDTLIAIIVLRSEIDLREIMQIYHDKFGVTLQDDVKGDTSGDYGNILLKILNLPEGEGVAQRKESVTKADVPEEEEEGSKGNVGVEKAEEPSLTIKKEAPQVVEEEEAEACGENSSMVVDTSCKEVEDNAESVEESPPAKIEAIEEAAEKEEETSVEEETGVEDVPEEVITSNPVSGKAGEEGSVGAEADGVDGGKSRKGDVGHSSTTNGSTKIP